MAPRQITDFFRPFGQAKRREDAAPASNEIRRTNTSEDAPERISRPHAKALVLSPKRAWHSGDVRRRRHAGGFNDVTVDEDAPSSRATQIAKPQIAASQAKPIQRDNTMSATLERPISPPTRPVTTSTDSHEDSHQRIVDLVSSSSDSDDVSVSPLDGAHDSPNGLQTKSASTRSSAGLTLKPQTLVDPRPARSGLERVASANRAPTSSLTTLGETPSFSSTSTKWISKEGAEMVMNSDTESESDESETLEDLDVVLARETAKKNGHALAPAGIQALFTTQAGKDRGMRSTGMRTSVTVKEMPKYKFSLGSLAPARTTTFNDAEEDELGSLNDSDSDADPPITIKTKPMDEDALAAIMPDDGEEPGQAGRMFHAMQQAEAFKEHSVYYYFNHIPESAAVTPSFPIGYLPRSGWAAMLRKPTQRQQVLSSGLAAKLCKSQPLPTEVLIWMLDSMRVGTSELLSLRYLEVLEQSGAQTADLVNEKLLETYLEQMGARQEHVMDRNVLKPRIAVERLLPTSLRWYLELIRLLAPDLESGALSSTLKSLFRMVVDDQVQRDGFILTLVQDTISDLLTNTKSDPEALEVLQQQIYDTWKLIGLQGVLIRSLPASNVHTHAFRRQLAYAFSLSKRPDASLIPRDLNGFDMVKQRLNDLSNQTKDTNYTDLASNIAMLDIAIDAGFAIQHRDESRESEQEFNVAVSKVAAAVRELESGLIGGGLSNLPKAAAKAALDRLWCRLQYSVRTTPPPQKDYFGGFADEQEKKVNFMSKWAKLEQGT